MGGICARARWVLGGCKAGAEWVLGWVSSGCQTGARWASGGGALGMTRSEEADGEGCTGALVCRRWGRGRAAR